MSAILKQNAVDIANAFEKYGLWKGGGNSNGVVYGGIDVNNLIYELTSSLTGTEWTATEDCYFIGEIICNNNTISLTLDNVPIVSIYDNSISSIKIPIFILKGQTIKYIASNNDFIRTAQIYGVKKSEKILHEYSTEEKIVGKWIDGNPIYEKTYSLNNINLLAGNNIFDTIENVKVINSNGRINNFSIPYADGGAYVMCVQSNNEIGLWTNNGFYNQSANIILTIQYIKTTD